MTDDRLNKIKASAKQGYMVLSSNELLDLIAEIEQYRKVVGLLGRGWDYWFISDSDAKANNLDIAGMK